MIGKDGKYEMNGKYAKYKRERTLFYIYLSNLQARNLTEI